MTTGHIIERTTDVTAAAAVISPVWLPLLKDVSDVSSLLLPVAGLVWLLIQIIGYTRRK